MSLDGITQPFYPYNVDGTLVSASGNTAGFVPYTGGTQNLLLPFDITASTLHTSSFSTDTSGNIHIGIQSSDVSGNVNVVYINATKRSTDVSGNTYIGNAIDIDASGNVCIGNTTNYSDISGNVQLGTSMKIDSSGNLIMNRLKGGYIYSDASGNTSVASSATSVNVAPKSDNVTYYPTFVATDVSGTDLLYVDGGGLLNYNPSLGVLSMNQASLLSQSMGSTGYYYPAMVKQNNSNYLYFSNGIQSQLYETASFAVDATNNRVITQNLRIPSLASVNLAVDANGNVVSGGTGSITQALTSGTNVYYPLMSTVNSAGTISTVDSDSTGNFNFNNNTKTLNSYNHTITNNLTSNSTSTSSLTITSLTTGTAVSNLSISSTGLVISTPIGTNATTINTTNATGNVYFLGSSSGYAGTNQIPYIQSNIYANYTTGVLNVPYGILSGASISTTNLALTGLTTGTVAYYLGVDPYGVVYKTTAVGPTITGQVGNVNYYLIGTNLTSGGLTVADIDNGNRFYFNPSSAYLYVANLGVTGSNGMTIANSSNPSLGIQIGTIGTIQTVFFTTGIATTAGYVPGTLANDSYIQASNNIVFQTPTTYGINYEIGNSQVVSINSSGLLIPTISNLTISGNLIIPSISSSTNYNTLLGLNIGSSKTVIGITAPTLSGLQVYNASAPAVNITNSATATTYITTAMVTSANAYITGTTVNDGIVYTSGNLWLGSSLSSGILTTNLPINGISIAFTNGTYQGVYWNSGSSTAAMSNVPVAGNFFTDAVVGDTILKATSGYSLRLGAGTGLSALDLTSSLVTANYPVQTNVGYGAGNGIRFPLIGYDYGYNGGNIYAGTADAYNPTGGNDLMIGSWYGLGFVSNTDNVTRGAINCRTGDLQMSGNIVSLGYFNCANTGSMQCYLNRTSASAGYGVVTVSQLNNVNHCVQGGGWRAGSAFNTYGSWFADPLNNGSFPSNSAMTNALIYADWVNGVYTNSSFTMNAGTMRILGTNPLYHESGTITNTTGANINLTPAGASLVTFNNLNYHSAPSGYFNSNYMTLWNTNSYGSGSTNNGTGIALTNSQNTGNFSLWSYGYGATSQYSSVYLISNYSGTGVTMAAGGTSWGAYSDARVKKNIKPIQDGLDNILQLKPVHYQYLKDEEDDVIKTHRHGFIAQEFDTVYPMHVNKQNAPYKDASGNDIENPWSIHTIEIIPDLVHSIQSLYKTNQQQATQIQTLTDHMTELTNQVNALTKLRSKK